jgi:hypothetical protein
MANFFSGLANGVGAVAGLTGLFSKPKTPDMPTNYSNVLAKRQVGNFDTLNPISMGAAFKLAERAGMQGVGDYANSLKPSGNTRVLGYQNTGEIQRNTYGDSQAVSDIRKRLKELNPNLSPEAMTWLGRGYTGYEWGNTPSYSVNGQTYSKDKFGSDVSKYLTPEQDAAVREYIGLIPGAFKTAAAAQASPQSGDYGEGSADKYGGGVYSSPEEQAIINRSYAQQASTINNSAQMMYQSLIERGMSPDQAKQQAANWANEQKSKSRLSGEQELRGMAINEGQRRLEQLAGITTGMQPNSVQDNSMGVYNAQLQAQQYNDGQQSQMWNALAGLAGNIGANSVRRDPLPVSGGTYKKIPTYEDDYAYSRRPDNY